MQFCQLKTTTKNPAKDLLVYGVQHQDAAEGRSLVFSISKYKVGLQCRLLTSINYQGQLLWQSKGFSPGLIKCGVNSKALHKTAYLLCPTYTVKQSRQLLSNHLKKPVATSLLFLDPY